MPKAFAGYLRVNAARKQVGGMSMPQVMEPDAPEPAPGDELLPFVRQAARLYRLAIRSGDH